MSSVPLFKKKTDPSDPVFFLDIWKQKEKGVRIGTYSIPPSPGEYLGDTLRYTWLLSDAEDTHGNAS